jgi:hypothetical protein
MNGTSPLDDWLLDHHKGAYQYQLERTDKLRERVSLIATLLTPLAAAEVYVLALYPHSKADCWSLWFYIPISISAILLLYTIGRVLYCVGWAFKYAFIPSPAALQEYVETLSEYAKTAPNEKVDVLLETKSDLAKSYCFYATRNLAVNKKRTRILLQAIQVAILSFLLLLASLPKFCLEVAQKAPEPTKVILVEPKTNKTMSGEERKPSPAPTVAPSDQPAAPPEPSAPQAPKPERPAFPLGTLESEASTRTQRLPNTKDNINNGEN